MISAQEACFDFARESFTFAIRPESEARNRIRIINGLIDRNGVESGHTSHNFQRAVTAPIRCTRYIQVPGSRRECEEPKRAEKPTEPPDSFGAIQHTTRTSLNVEWRALAFREIRCTNAQASRRSTPAREQTIEVSSLIEYPHKDRRTTGTGTLRQRDQDSYCISSPGK